MTQSKYYRFFNNLSNPLRIQIVECLKDKSKSVSEIAKELNVEQSKLSHALINMKCCSLVEVKQEGKQRIYSLNKKTLVPILKIIDKHAKTFCKEECCFCK